MNISLEHGYVIYHWGFPETLPAISPEVAQKLLKKCQKLLCVIKAAQKLLQKQTKRIFSCSLPLVGLMQDKSRIFKQFCVGYPALLRSFVLS